MLRVELADWRDAARVVDALLEAADSAEARLDRSLARRYRSIADDLGDALDTLDAPASNVIPLPRRPG